MITDFCVLCGTKDNLHNHHIIPRSKVGGTNDKTNIITLCTTHHATIHSLRPETWNKHSQLVREGQKKARERGVVLGRRTNLNDITKSRIVEMKLQGIGLKKIEKETRVSRKTIRKYLNYENMYCKITK
tara:strand:+ start:64 stop:450 length:387 start_codon:yes stop_codon:yes gene_type:complete